MDAALLCGLDRRPQHLAFLVPEQPVFARVGIESREREPRLRDAEARQLPRRQVDDAVDQLARQRARHGCQRHVDRREHHLERLRPEHHRDPRTAGQMRQQIGVPFPRQPRARERQLVHRRRRHRRDDAGLRIFHRGAERVVRRSARVGRQFTGGEPRTCRRAIHDRFTDLPDARIVGRLLRDLRTDAGGIAARDGDARLHRRHYARAASDNHR